MAKRQSSREGHPMTDWTAGYVADIGYTYGYYTELNPLRVRLAFLNAGLVPRTIKKLTHTVWAYKRSDVIDWLELLGSSS
jgi:hypothetical protein